MKMSKIKSVLILCLIFTNLSWAQTPVKHFMTVNAALNHANLLRHTKEASRLDVNPWFGSAPAIGIGYRLYKNHFTLDIGGELEYGVYTNRSKSDITECSQTVGAGSTEMIQNLNVNVPVMLGAEFGRFFFKAGALPSLCVYGTGSMTAADARQYKVSRPLQIRGRFEIGGQIGKYVAYGEQKTARHYVSIYADYGVLNERPYQRKGSYMDGVPYHICDESTADIVNNLTIGIRYTCLLDFSK